MVDPAHNVTRLRWFILALLFAATVINYIDRQSLSSFSCTPVFILMGCLHPVRFVLTWLVARHHRRASVAA